MSNASANIYTLGIDIGSTTSKCVLLKDGKRIVAHELIKAGTGTYGPRRILDQLFKKTAVKREEVAYTVVTGYGRVSFQGADCDMSELSCHAKGIYSFDNSVRTIIDIGGQDAKVIQLNDKGQMTNFAMNDKCAAGTGRFLDVMANILILDISDLEREYFLSQHPVRISSTCTVFAESEVISQLANGANRADVVAGICNSVASRVASFAKRVGVRETVFMSGGVAQNGGVRRALELELDVPIHYNEFSQMMGAYGAAVYAYEKAMK